jgi:hypothetical protein
MWLVHWTTIEGLKAILEDGEIKPSTKTKNLRFAHDEGLDDIFMSVLFEDEIPTRREGPFIIFPLEIMESYDVSHWSSSWQFGEVVDRKGEDNIQYDTDISAKENAEIWRKRFYELHPQKKYKKFTLLGGQQNEVVFSARPGDSISIPVGEASFIYTADAEELSGELIYDYDVIDDINKLNKLLKGI